MMRSAQLLDALEIRGWSLAHLQSGEYMVYVRHEGESEYLHGGKIDPAKAEYLFLRYARSGEPLTLFSLDNDVSSSIKLPSPFRSSGRFRTGPIPAENGSYTLVETYDGKGKVILKLDGVE